MAINNTLKDIREERNLIQADLAEAVGSCSQTIGRIERGERNPSLDVDGNFRWQYKDFVACL